MNAGRPRAGEGGAEGEGEGERPDVPPTAITRRDFLKAAGAGGVAVAAFPGCKPAWLDDGERVPGGPEAWYRATCTFCPSLCGTRVRVVNGNAVAVRGDPAHPKNMGALCPRGVAGLQHLYDLQRLVSPVARESRDAPLLRVAWDDALDLVAAKLGEMQPVGVDNRLYGIEADLATRFARAVGAIGGDPPAPPPAWDWERTRYVIAFGVEFLEEGPDLMANLRAFAALRGVAKFVYVGSRLGLTAQKFDEVVPVRPATERAVALAIGGAMDAEEAAKASGAPKATIERLAREFAKSSPQAAFGAPWLDTRGVVASPPLGEWEPAPAPRAPDPRAPGTPKALVVAGISPRPAPADFVVALSPTPVPWADVILPTTTWLEQESAHIPAIAGKQVVAYARPAKELRPPALVDARPAGRILIDLAQRMPSARRDFRWQSYEEALRERLVGIHDAQRGSIKENTFAAFRQKLDADGLWTDETPPLPPPVRPETPPFSPREETAGLVLLTFGTTTLGAGEGERLPWAQEITGWYHHLGWETWVEIHPKHGFRDGQEVLVASKRGSVVARAVSTPAIHPDAVAMPRTSVTSRLGARVAVTRI